MTEVRKRKLRESGESWKHWLHASPEERLKAVETINRLSEADYAKQAFPGVYRVTRKEKR